MDRDRFDSYIARFNEEDATAFDEFIHPDMLMINGALEFRGVAGMKAHYQEKIWPDFEEALHVLSFVSSETNLAVRMWTRFTARRSAATLFGPASRGDLVDYRGVVFYDIREGRFSQIVVAYNSFTHTRTDGLATALPIPH